MENLFWSSASFPLLNTILANTPPIYFLLEINYKFNFLMEDEDKKGLFDNGPQKKKVKFSIINP